MVSAKGKFFIILSIVLTATFEIAAFHQFHLQRRIISYRSYRSHQHQHKLQAQRGYDEEEVHVGSNELTYITFSRAFQRHVVFKCKEIDSCTLYECNSDDIIGSFMFLDDACKSFPNAQIRKLTDIAVKDDEADDHQLILGGMGTSSLSELVEQCDVSLDSAQRTFQYLHSLSSTGYRKSMPSSQSIYSISPLRFAHHKPETIHHNYNRVMDLLTRGRNRKYRENLSYTSSGNDLLSITKVGLAFEESVARAVISEFPQLCLYDIQELEDRIRFLVSPLQTTLEKDYYKMLKKGFGAGLTIDQTTAAIRVVPQLLAIFYEDSQKPSMIYFYKSLQISPASVSEARAELSQYMLGCDSSDVCTFAYLHSLGVSWDQIRLLLDAFPTLTFPDKEPSWDLIDTKIRSELQVDMLNYIRKRLQIGLGDIHSMLKVHSRLSTYSAMKVHSTMDILQHRLGLSSGELKRLVLRMPSIVGIQVNSQNEKSTLDKKLDFFYDEVKLTPNELRKAIAQMPSLLQYNLESLRWKYYFLTNDVGIPMESMRRVISLAPVLLGMSLDENLKPTVLVYKERCSLSSEELGKLIVTCPALLSLSVKRKIEPCFTFLESRLYISESVELGHLIKRAPRILQQGIETSLRLKVEMMQDAVKSQKKFQNKQFTDDTVSRETAQIFKSNPALLVTTNSILQSRIQKFKEDQRQDILDFFAKNNVGRKRKFSNDVLPTKLQPRYTKRRETPQQDHNVIVDSSIMTFSAMVSGQIYPRDTLREVRGKRKAGGIAILFPQISCGNFLVNFEDAMNMSFGMVMPPEFDGSNPEQNLALLGFPFLRPSRNRCDLYACHGALKVILQMLKQMAKKTDMRNTEVHVKIYTDSSYAWKYLKNSTQLMQWGSLKSINDMDLSGYGPAPLANKDLLLPLTNTYYRMSNNEATDKFGEQLELGNIKIAFLHSGDYQHSFTQISDMNKRAHRAAKWQFNKG